MPALDVSLAISEGKPYPERPADTDSEFNKRLSAELISESSSVASRLVVPSLEDGNDAERRVDRVCIARVG